MSHSIITVEIRYEHDVVLARQRARQLCALLGFEAQDQVRVATAVSELSRNAFQYAGGGRVEFVVTATSPQALEINVSDRGPGIPHLQEILDGRYVSSTGMGVGLIGAKRLMDRFSVSAEAGKGTRVTIARTLPLKTPFVSSAVVGRLAGELSRVSAQNPFEEIQRQNQELVRTLEELQKRGDELAKLNRELEDTNRGVVALYAELDEKADSLRRASELKTHFLSNMTHEFRTPLNSILSLSRMLLERIDGELTTEQEQQVQFIRSGATNLSDLVNDLLDLAKVEAGKMTVRPIEFHVPELFGALRGMLRPLLQYNSALKLVFDDPVDLPALQTDESKVSQILRNFISNAIKYTLSGEVRVSARLETPDTVVFEVSDTGIGIAHEDQERVFQEFVQIENSQQRQTKGTGLGLPLSKKMAELLGGSVALTSEPGQGSTFSLSIPLKYAGANAGDSLALGARPIDPRKLPVLMVDDNIETQFIYERCLQNTGYQPLPARTVKQARELLARVRPVAIVLDVLLSTENTWAYLTELKQSPETRDIPVLVVTMIDNETKARNLGADDFALKPIDRGWLLGKLHQFASPKHKILLIDDDPAARYVLKDLLGVLSGQVIEAGSGSQGLQAAAEHAPSMIFLDLAMPGMSGFEVLQLLKSNPVTKPIPVIIHTSKELSPAERERLMVHAVAILSKDHADREKSSAALREAMAAADAAAAQEVTHA